MPIGGKPVELRLPVPRLGCRDCGHIRQAAIRFAKPFRRVTHAFERYALGLLAHMTIQAVARDAGQTWLTSAMTTDLADPVAIDAANQRRGSSWSSAVLGAIPSIMPGAYCAPDE